MTTDKVFILLLVIMLPLSGCLTDDRNREEDDLILVEPSQIMDNNPPVIYYNYAGFSDYYDYDTSTLVENVIVITAGMAEDFDGDVIEFGIDTNQDGIIDFYLDKTGGQTIAQTAYNPDNMTDWMNPMPYDWGALPQDVEYCYQWLSLIAIDDDYEMSVEPFMALFDYDDETMLCELEAN